MGNELVLMMPPFTHLTDQQEQALKVITEMREALNNIGLAIDQCDVSTDKKSSFVERLRGEDGEILHTR